MRIFYFLFSISLFLISLTGFAQKKTVAKTPEKVYQFAEKMPEFPGGADSLFSFMIRNIKYPPEAYQNNIQGKVFLSFVVDTLGTVKDIQFLKNLDPFLDAEAMRVVKLMPKWNPGKENGRKVSVKYTLPVTFAIKTPPASEPDTIYTDKGVEVMPEFPGGLNAMNQFVNKNLRFPKEAIQLGVDGLVVVSFIVNQTGQLQDFIILKSVHPSLDNEAIRVLKAMPIWKPGTIKGKPVNVKFTFPLSFSIK